MLTVTGTVPAASAINVLRDASIDVTFSKELKSESLSAVNFVMYQMDDGTYVQQVLLGITKSGTLVQIAPIEDLLANTTYTLLILGDKDLGDGIPRGVVSTDADIMDDNYVFAFTTGEMLHIDIEGGAEASDSATASGVIELNVVETDPADLGRQVDNLATVTIGFDRYVTAVPGTDPISIEASSLIFGETPDMPGVDSIEYSSDHTSMIFNMSGTITGNTEYQITVDKDNISGSLDSWIDEDHVFRFFTQMQPYYTDPATVRRRGGHLISSTLPDWLIDMYILDASLWVSYELGVGILTGSSITYNITQLATCKVISDIAYGVADGTLKGIRKKVLADLQIEYDYRGSMAAINRFQNCIDTNLIKLGAGKVMVGVKSGDNGRYPGRRRTIWAE